MTIELRTRRYDEAHAAADAAETTETTADKGAEKKAKVVPDWVPAPVRDVVTRIETTRKESVKSAAETIRKAIREAASSQADVVGLTPSQKARIGADAEDLAAKLTKLDESVKHGETSNPFYKSLNEAIEGMRLIRDGVEALEATHHPIGLLPLVAGGHKLFTASEEMLKNAKAAGQLEPAKVWEPIVRDLRAVMASFEKLSHDVSDIAFARTSVRVAG